MAAPGVRHYYQRGEPIHDGSLGRPALACAECGDRRLAPVHIRTRRLPGPGVVAAVKPPVQLPAPADARPVADWRLTMLRLAMDQALDGGVDLPFTLRRALLDARGALRSALHGTVATEAARVEVLSPEPRGNGAVIDQAPARPQLVRPARDPVEASARLRSMLHGIRGDKQRELVRRAIAQGWRWERTGTDHVRLLGPDGQTVVVSGTAGATRGRGFANLRAAARRAGLDVEGL